MKAIVLTSNGYQDILPAFAFLANKWFDPMVEWTAAGYEMMPKRPLPKNFEWVGLGKQKDYSFTAGLRKLVGGLRGKLVLLMLEDYWLTDMVSLAQFREVYWAMLVREEWVKFDLSGDAVKREHLVHGENGFIQAKSEARYLASLQAAIWRREYLMDLLNGMEADPWQFEREGTHKMRELGGTVMGTAAPVMRYVNAVGGQGRKPGALDMEKIPAEMLEDLVDRGLV